MASTKLARAEQQSEARRKPRQRRRCQHKASPIPSSPGETGSEEFVGHDPKQKPIHSQSNHLGKLTTKESHPWVFWWRRRTWFRTVTTGNPLGAATSAALKTSVV